jgi:hypothetical protein
MGFVWRLRARDEDHAIQREGARDCAGGFHMSAMNRVERTPENSDTTLAAWGAHSVHSRS